MKIPLSINYNYLKHCNLEETNYEWIAEYAYYSHVEEIPNVRYIDRGNIIAKDFIINLWSEGELTEIKMPENIDKRTAISTAMYITSLAKFKLPEEKLNSENSSYMREDIYISGLPIINRTSNRRVKGYDDPVYKNWNKNLRQQIRNMKIKNVRLGEETLLNEIRTRLIKYKEDDYSQMFAKANPEERLCQSPDTFTEPEVPIYTETQKLMDIEALLRDKRISDLEIEETIDRDDGVKYTRKIKAVLKK